MPCQGRSRRRRGPTASLYGAWRSAKLGHWDRRLNATQSANFKPLVFGEIHAAGNSQGTNACVSTLKSGAGRSTKPVTRRRPSCSAEATGWCRCASIARSSDGDLLFSASGEAQPAKHKCKPYTLRGPYSVGMLVLGVIACAGPAAETRHRLETKAPLRGLVRFSGDHSSVEIIDKYLAGRQGRHYHRYRGAFQRLA